ncbi:MAG TPA: autorepressor SdpR family transcription factor [Bacteroidota bacterium]|nr:autorepressor SdpR family transcription factor [Bacteroidota bacterium]
MLFKALADPTRREILRLLRQKDMTPSQILEKIEVSQPTLSHHLDSLRRANLVDTERDGQFIRYSLNMSVFDLAAEYMMQFKNKR